MEEQERFFPVLSHFREKNPWAASDGRLRYRIIPTVIEKKEGEEDKSFLTVEVWEGPWAYEFSTVEESRVFPLTEEGRSQVQEWLQQWSETVAARPRRTMAEYLARRKEPEA